MQSMKTREIIEAVSGTLVQGDPESVVRSVSTDTRALKEGQFFVALKGKNFDGMNFVKPALETGAAGALVSSTAGLDGLGGIIIQVPDTRQALLSLAKFYRRRFNAAKIICLTGSNGKTTTKEMTAWILSGKYRVVKSIKSYNNDIGVPLTLFNLDPGVDFAVLEIGMNHPGEISRLAEVAMPEIGVVLNVGPAHLEGLGSIEAVAKEKAELLNALPETGTAVVNADDPLVARMVSGLRPGVRVVRFGMSATDVSAKNMENTPTGLRFRLRIESQEANIRLSLTGFHNLSNALAASAAAWSAGLDLREIADCLETFKLEADGRFQKIKVGETEFINDAYNANPASVEASLRNMAELQSGRKIAVLGDMLELGEYSKAGHQHIGLLVPELGIDFLVLVGRQAKEIGKQAIASGFDSKKVAGFNEKDSAAVFLADIIKPGDSVLLKGSRRLKLEEIIRKVSEMKNRRWR